jgi:hypothetical protein
MGPRRAKHYPGRRKEGQGRQRDGLGRYSHYPGRLMSTDTAEVGSMGERNGKRDGLTGYRRMLTTRTTKQRTSGGC